MVRRLLCNPEGSLEFKDPDRLAVLLLRLWRRALGSRHRYPDRREEAAARRRAVRRGPLDQSGDRYRPGRGRVHPGHGLADDRGALVEQGWPPDDPCAV